MGYWAKTIMGGDRPLDINNEIFEIIDVDKFDKTINKELIKTLFEKNQIKITSKLKKYGNDAFLVIGYLFLTYGVKINNSLKIKIKNACDNDEWSKMDVERKKYVNELKSGLEINDGAKLLTKDEGLFAIMFKDMLKTKNKT